MPPFGARGLSQGNGDVKRFAVGGVPPISVEIARAASMTICPSCDKRASSMRAIGPETETAAMASPVSSKIGAAMQRKPTACSSSSTA